MKKFLLLFSFLIAVFSFAQNPDLLNFNWKIVSLKVNSQIYSPTLTDKKISFANNSFIATYFNILNAEIIYNNSEFSLSNANVTMADPFNSSIAEFDGNYLENFWGKRIPNNLNYISPNNPFNYNISSDGNTLTITNSKGDIATYNKEILATQDIQKNQSKIYPNPTSDFIFIENAKTNSLVKIIDVSGKIVLEKKLSGNSIDVKSLSKGIYFIEIEGNKPLKFIKK